MNFVKSHIASNDTKHSSSSIFKDPIFKQNEGLSSFTLERYPCTSQNFLEVSLFFLIRCGCRSIWKTFKMKLLSAF